MINSIDWLHDDEHYALKLKKNMNYVSSMHAAMLCHQHYVFVTGSTRDQ